MAICEVNTFDGTTEQLEHKAEMNIPSSMNTYVTIESLSGHKFLKKKSHENKTISNIGDIKIATCFSRMVHVK